MLNIDLVIAYYKEDLDWLENYKNIDFRNIFIYNKGPLEIPNINRSFIEIKLNNIGKCDHTYLYHIINNYNNLADVTIFTTGSVSIPYKTEQFNIILENSISTMDSVFWALDINIESVRDNQYNFTLDEYNSTHENNKNINKEDNIIMPSEIRPFGVWYDTYFPHINIKRINYRGIFSVSKKHILQHELLYYKKLINLFPNHPNPEVGHYFERSWLAVFHPIPNSCILPIVETFENNNLILYFFIIFLIILVIIIFFNKIY